MAGLSSLPESFPSLWPTRPSRGRRGDGPRLLPLAVPLLDPRLSVSRCILVLAPSLVLPVRPGTLVKRGLIVAAPAFGIHESRNVETKARDLVERTAP